MMTATAGLENVLRAEFPSDFILFSVDSTISSLKPIIFQELLKDPEADNQPESKHVFHIVNFVYDFSEELKSRGGRRGSRLILYDYVQESFPGLDEFYKTFLSNLNSFEANGKKNIVLIDDLTLFLIHCSDDSDSDSGNKVQRLFRQLGSMPKVKIIGFVQKETLELEKVSLLCDEADTIVILANNHESGFTSTVLRSKFSGKTTTETGNYEISKGLIKKLSSTKSQKTTPDNKDDLLTSLTTFKLTLEENEKDSKNRLYLPYFEAQRTTPVDPYDDNFEEDDEDEV